MTVSGLAPLSFAADGIAAAGPDRCALAARIAAVARGEVARWRRGDVRLVESDPGQLPVLQEYWSAVPGFGTAGRALAQARLSARDAVPWSAAFVCWVMRRAGVRPGAGFEFSPRHITYIVGALRNRERSDVSRPFWLVDDLELQHEAVPRPGDLVCFNRAAAGAMTRHSVDRLRQAYWENGRQDVVPSGSSHCAVVVGTTTRGRQRGGVTVGGNESNSVGRRFLPVDRWGGLLNPAARNVFGAITLVGCDPAAHR